LKYHFDRIINRRGTDSVKWDGMESLFPENDLLPLWVADMDFPSPPEVTRALVRRARHPAYGYTLTSEHYYDAVRKWLFKRFQWDVCQEDILTTPGIVTALALCIEAFTAPGDEVVIQPPVYPPFFSVVTQAGRHLILNPLRQTGETYLMDLDDLKEKISPRTKLLLLCSPHNPVGRVWTREELCALGELCERQGITVISDEIHADLVFPGHTHTPTALSHPGLPGRTVTCTAPSKTFNIPGLYGSNIIISDRVLKEAYQAVLERFHLSSLNLFALESAVAAYSSGEPWLESLLDYLYKNLFYLRNRLRAIPGVEFPVLPQGTTLAWISFKPWLKRGLDYRDLVIRRAGIALNDGSDFGEEGSGYMRLNFACPRPLLKQAMDRLEDASRLFWPE
jgi:cystathionine beta-lyase